MGRMASISSGISRNSDGRSRCLLLVPRGRDAPVDLLDGLRQRRVALREVSDPPAVMAALAHGSFDSVVIVEPPSMPDARALVLALAEYHPHVRLWEYRFEGPIRLTPLDPAAEGAERPAGAPIEDAVVADQEVGDLTPSPGPVPPATGSQATPPAAADDVGLDGPGVVLTEQELAMLLDETDASA